MTITTLEMFLKEMGQEAETTRMMLERLPDDKYDWQPHPKSMSLQRLANHIAELPDWVAMVLNTEELDFEKNPYQPDDADNTADLLKFFEKSLASGRSELSKAKKEQLMDTWTLRAGKQIFTTSKKWEMIRHTFCQIVHHRAQLGVYLRLLDIPIPSSYGGSADDPSF